MSEDKSLRDRIKEDFQAVTNSGTLEDYIRFSGDLEKMDGELRDFAQKMAIDDMKSVLEKLKNDEELADCDFVKLKSWVVGDAEYYISKENDYDTWSADLKRIMDKITLLWIENPDPQRLLELRGLARDALGSVSDLTYYVKQKESVEKFNAATRQIGETERVVLMSLLEQKISASRL